METNKLYETKFDAFQKAMNRQEGSYVPNGISNSGGGLFWSGKTAYEVAGDKEAYAKAMTSFLDEMWVDVNTMSGLTTTPRLDATFPTSETRIAQDGTLTHLQNSRMQPDDYDQLIKDPKAFITEVMLPRKYPYLFESRDKTKELLKVYAEEQIGGVAGQMMYTNQYLTRVYGVHNAINSACLLNTPLDHLFDFFRGFRGTLTDLRRQPEKVKAALDAIWEYQLEPLLAHPYDPTPGFPFQPCHIPAYLSPKQFRELYWPYEKKIIEWVHASGSKLFLILEGRWENIMDCFLEVPKDSMMLAVDDDDFLKVHEVLGHHQILFGGLKIADTRLKKFEDIKDSIKNVIDTCAPGGGLVFSTNKMLLTRGDINPVLIECFNFAHEYSSK